MYGVHIHLIDFLYDLKCRYNIKTYTIHGSHSKRRGESVSRPFRVVSLAFLQFCGCFHHGAPQTLCQVGSLVLLDAMHLGQVVCTNRLTPLKQNPTSVLVEVGEIYKTIQNTCVQLLQHNLPADHLITAQVILVLNTS